MWDIHPTIMPQLDDFDRKILSTLQTDATLSVEAVSERVNLSRNACWRRIKRLEHDKIIRERVTLIDADAVGLGLTVFVMIHNDRHDLQWLQKFEHAVRKLPNVVGAYRMTGDLDYILKVRVADMKAYDRFYQRLIAEISVTRVSASFVMEDIKDSVKLPIGIA